MQPIQANYPGGGTVAYTNAQAVWLIETELVVDLYAKTNFTIEPNLYPWKALNLGHITFSFETVLNWKNHLARYKDYDKITSEMSQKENIVDAVIALSEKVRIEISNYDQLITDVNSIRGAVETIRQEIATIRNRKRRHAENDIIINRLGDRTMSDIFHHTFSDTPTRTIAINNGESFIEPQPSTSVSQVSESIEQQQHKDVPKKPTITFSVDEINLRKPNLVLASTLEGPPVVTPSTTIKFPENKTTITTTTIPQLPLNGFPYELLPTNKKENMENKLYNIKICERDKYCNHPPRGNSLNSPEIAPEDEIVKLKGTKFPIHSRRNDYNDFNETKYLQQFKPTTEFNKNHWLSVLPTNIVKLNTDTELRKRRYRKEYGRFRRIIRFRIR